ncbi:MAG: PKD domain-containing protein [Bacteroidia bacterium]|nr:PKD domain-containing protein [Bacteroidia bacterium]
MRYLQLLTVITALGLWNQGWAQSPVGSEESNPSEIVLQLAPSSLYTGQGTLNTLDPGFANQEGLPGKDAYFKIVLPRCFDSLIIRTCPTGFNTYLTVKSAGVSYELSNDDNTDANPVLCPAPDDNRAGIVLINGTGANTASAVTTRDTFPLEQGREIILRVEGFDATDEGEIVVEVTGYPSTLPPPSPPFFFPNREVRVCVSNLYPIEVPGGAQRYVWYVNNQLRQDHPANFYTLLFSEGAGEYEVVVLAINSPSPGSFCPADTSRDTLLVVATPGASLPPGIDLGPDRSVCISDGSLELTVAPGADFYQWYVDGNLQPYITNTFTLTFSSAGTYTVSVTAISNPPPFSVCTDQATLTDEVVITVTEAAPALGSIQLTNPVDNTPLDDDTTVCISAGSIQLEATEGAQTYEWYVDNFLITSSSLREFTFSLFAPGTYTVRVVGINSPPPGSACNPVQAQDELTVTVTPAAPPAPVMSLGPDQTVCVSQGSVSFEVEEGADVYEWYVNDDLQPDATGRNFTLQFTDPGTYTVRVRAISNPPSGSVCTGQSISEDEVEITVTPAAAPAPVMNLGGDRSVCITDATVVFEVEPGAEVYEWYVNGVLQEDVTGPEFVLTLTAAGEETVEVRAINYPPDGSVCTDPSVSADAAVITVSPAPNASIAIGNTTYNSGQTYNASGRDSVVVVFRAQSNVSGNSYEWQLYASGNNTPIATGDDDTLKYVFRQRGNYQLILISTNGACEERDTLNVNVSITTSLLTAAGSFSAFPNPNTGSFTVMMPVAGLYELQVLDLSGRVVYMDRLQGDRKDIRLSVPAGLYQLLISGEGRSALIRLLITE